MDSDPEEQKMTHKIEKSLEIHVLKCWMFFFEGPRLLL
jgi:hypothetical protein